MKPELVKIPDQEVYINMTSMFQLLQQFDNNPKQISEGLLKCIKYISTNLIEESDLTGHERVAVNTMLFDLLEVFQSMKKLS